MYRLEHQTQRLFQPDIKIFLILKKGNFSIKFPFFVINGKLPDIT